MNKNIRVEVTQADIDEGVKHSSYKCMMALAIGRAVNAVVMVTSRFAAVEELVDGNVTKRIWYEFTDRTIKRIRQFDDGETVKPFVTIIRGV